MLEDDQSLINTKASDLGVFIGMATLPIGSENIFLENPLIRLFEEYKKKTSEESASSDAQDYKDSFEAYFYKPIPYYLFGNFDIGLLSVVDDFTFSSRYFHPYSQLLKDEDENALENDENFTFKAINGLIPDYKNSNTTPKALYSLIESNDLPLLGIVNLKLENSLLIGSGNFFTSLIIDKINRVLAKYKNLSYQILYNWSWNEITLLCFSDSYKRMTDAVIKVRSLKLEELVEGIDGAENEKDLNESYKYLKDNALFTKNPNKECEGKPIEKVRVFAHSHSTYGFKYDLYAGGDSKPNGFPSNERLDFFIRWYAKPGHSNDIKDELIKQGLANNDLKLTVGKGDIGYTVQKTLKELVSYLRELLGDGDYVPKKDEAQKDEGKKDYPFLNYVTKIHTILLLNSTSIENNKGTQGKVEEYCPFNNGLKRYAFPLKDINKIAKDLRYLRLSKAISEKVVNMYVIFNDGIQDPIQYGYFIELRSFLDALKNKIDEITNSVKSTQYRQDQKWTVLKITEYLNSFIKEFSVANQNRFGQTYVMDDISDYNIFFSGGIQQLLVAYDNCYKTLTHYFGDKEKISFTTVEGETDIVSSYFRVRLNYFHLFQPEMFALVAVHEAANDYFDRLGSEGFNKLFKGFHKWIDYKTSIKSIPDSIKEYSIKDILTFVVGFHANDDLFFYWFWGNFLQNPFYYEFCPNEKKYILNEDAFFERWFRYYTIAEIEKKASLRITGYERFNEVNLIYEYWKEHADSRLAFPDNGEEWKTKEFVRELLGSKVSLNIEKLKEELNEAFTEEFEKLLKNLKITDLRSFFTFFLDYYKWLNLISIFQQSIYDSSNAGKASIYTSLWFKVTKSLELHFKKIIKKGEIINLQDFEKIDKSKLETIINSHNTALSLEEKSALKDLKPIKDFDQTFILICILNAYLKLIKEINPSKINLLKIDEEGNIDKEGHENLYYFNPTGGGVILGFEERRKYLKYRVSFIQTLWHLGQIRKREYFD